MSIKIHHGPPGSYKTSGAVMDDLIPAIKAGRPIVTNVRGISLDRIFETFPDTPNTIELITVDTKSAEGRARLANWFHWVPLGAFIIIDEAQMVWPKSWRDADLAKLNFPPTESLNYVDAAAAAGRPADFLTAFDMHRHYNWDLVLTTPDIKKIRDDIRGAAEMAYKHKNLATLGSFFAGRYVESTHSAQDNGSAVSQFTTVTRRKIIKEVWSLYESTATGQHQDTKAGRSIFRDPKIMALLALLACCLSFGVYGAATSNLFGKSAPPPVAPKLEPVQVAAVAPVATAGSVSVPVVPVSQQPAIRAVDPLGSVTLSIVGTIQKEGEEPLMYFSTGFDNAGSHLTDRDLKKMGYTFAMVSPCVVRMMNFDFGTQRVITCPATTVDKVNLTGAASITG